MQWPPQCANPSKSFLYQQSRGLYSSSHHHHHHEIPTHYIMNTNLFGHGKGHQGHGYTYWSKKNQIGDSGKTLPHSFQLNNRLPNSKKNKIDDQLPPPLPPSLPIKKGSTGLFKIIGPRNVANTTTEKYNPCGDPPAVANGQTIHPTTQGGFVTVICDPGYVVSGPTIYLTCGADGHWYPPPNEQPRCVKILSKGRSKNYNGL